VQLIRVVIADDDEGYLAFLGELIDHQPELTVVGRAGDGVEAVELVDRLEPEAAVVDLHMPRMDGVAAVFRMREAHPSICLIALTGDSAPELSEAATDAGADGVFLKGEMVDNLVQRLADLRRSA
jgi:DNA-binding NarL/FixJ family response regulator